MRRIAYAALVAVAIASLAIDDRIAGAEVWKWVFGVIGLVVFLANGRQRR